MVLAGSLCFWLLTTASPAATPDAPARSAQEDFGALLEAARDAYLAGATEAALEQLGRLAARIDAGEQVERELESEALIYLGEAQLLVLGDNFTAFSTFERLLTKYPDQPISAFEHPSAVVSLFEAARKEVRTHQAETPDPPPQPALPPAIEPLPAWGYLPFGVPQLAQEQVVAGVTLGVLQAGLAAGSIALLVDLSSSPGGFLGGPGGESGSDEAIAYETKRAVQLSLTGGFYATWALSWGLGRVRWVRRARERRTVPTVSLSIDPQGTSSLVVSGRF